MSWRWRSSTSTTSSSATTASATSTATASCAASPRRSRTAASGDACFRLGGDEFALLLPHTDAYGAQVALEEALGRGQAALPGVSLSVGIGALSSAAGDFALLREQADAAVYEAKRTIGSAIVVFDEISSSTTLTHPDRVRGLGELLEHGELDVAFQPIWDLERNAILGYEALARPDAALRLQRPGRALRPRREARQRAPAGRDRPPQRAATGERPARRTRCCSSTSHRSRSSATRSRARPWSTPCTPPAWSRTSSCSS